jgi:hypothetical protein
MGVYGGRLQDGGCCAELHDEGVGLRRQRERILTVIESIEDVDSTTLILMDSQGDCS